MGRGHPVISVSATLVRNSHDAQLQEWMPSWLTWPKSPHNLADILIFGLLNPSQQRADMTSRRLPNMPSLYASQNGESARRKDSRSPTGENLEETRTLPCLWYGKKIPIKQGCESLGEWLGTWRHTSCPSLWRFARASAQDELVTL
jgi:hypothetical protein